MKCASNQSTESFDSSMLVQLLRWRMRPGYGRPDNRTLTVKCKGGSGGCFGSLHWRMFECLYPANSITEA
ncbi:hypothetical protein PVAP13_9NG111700 [Panicum virgatum]|uniref:Uncharacterized protein n=1 Tax=Panicum virgatum TaxID=38727 RepID=A0A8T0MF72_PANVG|nr:hypothetical protein PVAP13_9NG111700 [Panicum virgatum]